MSEWNQKELLGSPRYTAKSTALITGTTTDTSTQVVDLDTRQMSESVFLISNTGSHSLYYLIRVRNSYGEDLDFEVFSNEITADDVDEVILCRHARVFIDMKSFVPGDATNFGIVVIGGT